VWRKRWLIEHEAGMVGTDGIATETMTLFSEVRHR